jgi:hypothetical protein
MPHKFFVDGGAVAVIHHLVYDLDADGKKLTCRQLTDYTGEKVRTLYPNAADFRHDWLDPDKRVLIADELFERGIDVESLAETLNRPEADPFDLLCHLAYCGLGVNGQIASDMKKRPSSPNMVQMRAPSSTPCWKSMPNMAKPNSSCPMRWRWLHSTGSAMSLKSRAASVERRT